MIRPWLNKASSPELCDCIYSHWIAALPQITSALTLDLYRLRLFYDQLILDAIARVDRRVLFVNLVNACVELLSYGSQLANILLLVMVLGHWADPWPAMQFALPTIVLVVLAFDFYWTYRLYDKVMGR